MSAPASLPGNHDGDSLNRRLLVVVVVPNPTARPLLPSWLRPGPITALTAEDIARWCMTEAARAERAPWN